MNGQELSSPQAEEIVDVTVAAPKGLHLRPADIVSKFFQSRNIQATLQNGKEAVDARSILGILTLGAAQGVHCTLRMKGPPDVLRGVRQDFLALSLEGEEGLIFREKPQQAPSVEETAIVEESSNS